LPDNAEQRPASDRIMQRDWNRDSSLFDPHLHDSMTSSLSHGGESFAFQNPANLPTRKSPKFTQP
jgi:hypothetical protein